MDPPPLPSLPTTTTAAAAAAAATPPAAAAAASIQLNYPDSVDSSPRSRNADTWVDDHLPPVPGAKLRLMCSYGGHIIPRPHDKSLCYVGGDTRIVVVDRHSSLSDLCSRLSRTLFHGRPFTLKYQLPSEDLDSLISVTTDEDLENMIDEYDRTAASSPLKPSRLRLFLFFVKPETAASMGALLDDAKSETWFVDALNGSGLLPRGLSDSAMDDCLLSLDDGVRGSDSCNDLEAQGNFLGENNKQVVGKNNIHEVQYAMPDSPMVENNSSVGSSSSSPSMSNLPPIRVRVDENGARGQGQRVGMEEQFAQISFAAAPPIPAAHGVVSVGHQVNPMFVPGENMNKVLSDDERSDHGAPVGFRKPPLPLQPVQPKAATGGYSLPSPDSVASDTSSITSACSLSKPMYYQDQLHAPPREIRCPASPDSRNNDNSDPGPGTQQAKDSGYLIPQQLDQQHHHHHQHQQFAQYIHHPVAANPVHMSPYYQVYPQTPQQFHHPMDQQYPVYVMPVAPQTQPYNMSLQSNVADTTTTVIASSRPVTSMVPAPGPTYKQEGIPPVYPAKAASPALPDMAGATAAGVYKSAVGSNPSLVQIPPNQYQQAYVGYSQMHHHPSQSIAVPSSAPGNYAYEYANPAVAQHEQVYYAQHPAQAAAAAPAPLPSQYQSMTPAAAAAIALSEAAKQLPADNNAQQQIRTSQPL
ncbi:PB1 domain containing protein [Parasponia andersonii]|uniref:PB1 domain containing protein n=1 Tax=Parasponia andersonii TaxID=3476 RepID=A0A2P5A6R0_PARAD|nr:PB1 domain containing protein [Parasponia andersonii]